MKKFFSQAAAGFSVIELMIVLSIVTIMTAVLFNVNRQGAIDQDAKSVAQQIAAEIKTLQNDALTGKQIANGSGNFVTACRFIFSNTSTSYTLSYDKNCSGTAAIISTQTIDVSKFHVTLSASPDLIFSAPHGAISPSAGTNIIVTSSKSGTGKTVTINSLGSVEIQ